MPHPKSIVGTPGIATLVLLLVGCSEPTAAISGKVTYKGAPVTVGSISFNIRNKGIAQNAALDSTGAYTMAVPMPPGTYQVYYAPPPLPPPGSMKVGEPVAKSIVPKKYHTLESSALSFEVKAGQNDIPIELKD